MSEIDPHNLGPEVYKYDQVITLQDLIKLRKHYYNLENVLYLNKQLDESFKACIGHLTVEALIEWLEEGKPSLTVEDSNEQNS